MKIGKINIEPVDRAEAQKRLLADTQSRNLQLAEYLENLNILLLKKYLEHMGDDSLLLISRNCSDSYPTEAKENMLTTCISGWRPGDKMRRDPNLPWVLIDPKAFGIDDVEKTARLIWEYLPFCEYITEIEKIQKWF